MDKKLKAKWLKALRSGRYKQGHEYLKPDGRYCCLGVLASIQGCKWKDPYGEREKVPFIHGKQASPGHSSVGLLRPCFAGGLRTAQQRKLARMNDGDDGNGATSSFKQIAGYIEKHY